MVRSDTTALNRGNTFTLTPPTSTRPSSRSDSVATILCRNVSDEKEILDATMRSRATVNARPMAKSIQTRGRLDRWRTEAEALGTRLTAVTAPAAAQFVPAIVL